MKTRAGDILLFPVTPRSSWASKFVAVGELLLGMGRGAEEYSHCAIVDIDEGWQLEAYWPRTRRSRIDPRRPREVWRLHGERREQTERGVRWCYENLNKLYNMLGLLFGWLPGARFHNKYCSQYVRASKAAAGHRMPNDERGYFSPNQLADYCRTHGTLIERTGGL